MKIILFLPCLFSIFSFSAQAAFRPGSVSSATGGTGRGVTEPVDSVLLNPAVIGLLPTKFFDVNYTNEQWGITISDNGRDSLFPAALAYFKSDINSFKTEQISLALAYEYKKLFSVGVNFAYAGYNVPGFPYDSKYQQTLADVGFLFSPTPVWGVGLVAYKAVASNTDMPDVFQKQKTFALGTQYTYLEFIRFRFDLESAPDNKTDRLVYMGGLETFINDWIIIRLGYENNNVVSKNYSSAGIGFAGPQFQVHYAYISNVADSTDVKHSFDLGIPF